MLEIPRLTVREFEIAPLLIANATREEIAQHLNISEETVKQHTRNILRKFNAVSVRDAYDAISDHIFVFGPEGLHKNYFYHALKRDLFIAPNRTDGHFKEVLEVEAIYRPFTEFSVEMVHATGWIENKCINGKSLTPRDDKALFDVWSAPIHPPLEPGKIGTIVHSMDHIGHYPDNRNSLSVSVRQPIGTINYRVHFQPDDIPARVYGKKQSIISSQISENISIEFSKGVAHLNVNLPSSKYVFGICWEWE